MEQNSIFTFTDYRTFLKTHLDQKREENSNWSLGVWTQKMGLTSKSTLAMVLTGKRHPGNKLKKKLSEYFNFTKKEYEYFSDLIRLQKSENDTRLSVLIMENMGKISPNGNFRLLNDEEFSAISRWHYYAIREMVHLEDFNEEPAWIQERLNFKITRNEITKTINDLLSLNLLKRAQGNRLQQTDGKISSTSGIASEAIKRNHEQNIDHAREAVRKIDVENRYMSGITLTIKEENMAKAKELIEQFEDKFIELMEEKPGNSTVQLNIQLFPLTKINSEGRQNHVLH